MPLRSLLRLRAALFLQREKGLLGERGTCFQKDRQEVRTLAEGRMNEDWERGSNHFLHLLSFLIGCLTLAAPLLRKQESDGHFPRDDSAGTA